MDKKTPGALLQLGICELVLTVENRREASAASEIPLFEVSKHNFDPHKNTGEGHCLVGSFTGEVGSYNATEPHKGWLTLDGNQSDSANA